MKKHLILAIAVTTLVACSDSSGPAAPLPTPQPTPDETTQDINNTTAHQTAVSEPVEIIIEAPAGQYQLDPHHSNLYFTVRHLGVSNYVLRFTDFDVTVDLQPDDLAASSVSATIDAASIRTDFDGDYAGAHPDSSFASWNEDLAMSENFLNAGEYPVISFQSTSVTPTDEGTLQVTGDLELLGETQPVTLEATVVGSEQMHPFTGVGLIGFSATGTFNRSDFGMTHLANPPIVGDVITLHFEGELLQQEPATDSDEL